MSSRMMSCPLSRMTYKITSVSSSSAILKFGSSEISRYFLPPDAFSALRMLPKCVCGGQEPHPALGLRTHISAVRVSSCDPSGLAALGG